jgi:hypothetical protein
MAEQEGPRFPASRDDRCLVSVALVNPLIILAGAFNSLGTVVPEMFRSGGKPEIDG